MTERDAETFDILDMLSGNKFPEETVRVYVNEDLMYRVAEIEEKIQRNPEDASLEAEREELVRKAREFEFQVHVQGIPRASLMNAVQKVEEQFPSEYTALGRRKPNAQADNAMAVLQWVLYVKKIVSPSGAEAGPLSEEEAEALRGQLPLPAVEAVERAISDIHEKTNKGHETLAMETDFLSKR